MKHPMPGSKADKVEDKREGEKDSPAEDRKDMMEQMPPFMAARYKKAKKKGGL
jgi:hypothetical protein